MHHVFNACVMDVVLFKSFFHTHNWYMHTQTHMHTHTRTWSSAPQLVSCEWNWFVGILWSPFVIRLPYNHLHVYTHPIANNFPITALVARQLQLDTYTRTYIITHRHTHTHMHLSPGQLFREYSEPVVLLNDLLSSLVQLILPDGPLLLKFHPLFFVAFDPRLEIMLLSLLHLQQLLVAGYAVIQLLVTLLKEA